MQTITLFFLTLCGVMVAVRATFRQKEHYKLLLYNVNNPIDHCVFHDGSHQ